VRGGRGVRDGTPARARAASAGIRAGPPGGNRGGQPRRRVGRGGPAAVADPGPPGAARLARPPRSLPGPALGRPAVGSLVDRILAWRARVPFAAVQAWLSAHPPRGLPADGSASGGNSNTGQTTMTGTSYRGPASRAWQSADLEISAAPAGPDASVIRADAVIVWLDPRAVPSGPGAHPVRVTIAGGCPPADQGVTGVANPVAGLSKRLLPPGPPTAGLRCRYDGLNGHPWHLAAPGGSPPRQPARPPGRRRACRSATPTAA
jgi:hypothetical protein